MAKVLVTGGAGFLGSHLIRRLLEAGHDVTALDNLSTGTWTNLPIHPRLNCLEQDVEDPIHLEVQQIFHLACPASPPKYQLDALKTLTTSFVGTRNVLELARKNRARLLFTSTSEIYGDPNVSPQTESYWGNVNSFGPRSCYDEGKRAAEALCYCYIEQFQLELRISRIFNTYGPNMALDDGRVVSNFIVQALSNQPLTLYGDGNQTRSLCYVDDLVEGLLKLMDSQVTTPVNLGNPTELTVKDLAKKILAITHSSSEISYLPLPQDDPRCRRPDISKAQRFLAWEPKVSLDEGLFKTCSYFQNLLADR